MFVVVFEGWERLIHEDAFRGNRWLDRGRGTGNDRHNGGDSTPLVVIYANFCLHQGRGSRAMFGSRVLESL